MINKNIPRIYIKNTFKEKKIIELDGPSKHYLKNVLRLSAGRKVHIFNGSEGEWTSVVSNQSNFSIQCINQIKKQTKNEGPNLYFALIKSINLRWMIEKATELGVNKINPIITDHTIVRSLNEKRLTLNIKEASEVSERLNLPHLEKIKTLEMCLMELKKRRETLVFCNEKRDDIYLHDYLSKNFDKNISFLIGPEGGFSVREHDLLDTYENVVSIKLNNRILRAETASILALSTYNLYNIKNCD